VALLTASREKLNPSKRISSQVEAYREVAGVSPLEGEAERRGVGGWSEGKAFLCSVGVGSALAWTQLSWSVVG